jgi:hypothetical protein
MFLSLPENQHWPMPTPPLHYPHLPLSFAATQGPCHAVPGLLSKVFLLRIVVFKTKPKTSKVMKVKGLLGRWKRKGKGGQGRKDKKE